MHGEAARRQLDDVVFGDLGALVRESLPSAFPGAASERVRARMEAIERRVAERLKPSGGDAAEAPRVAEQLVGRARLTVWFCP